MTVFDLFSQTGYRLLKIQRGSTYGNRIVEVSDEKKGVFRKRIGMRRDFSGEVYSERSTLFIRPCDIDCDLVGMGVRIDGVEYEIVSVDEGFNYDSGQIDHLKTTLKKVELS